MRWIAIFLLIVGGLIVERGWRFALGYSALLVGVVVSAILLRIAYELWKMPEWRRRELDEEYRQRERNRTMVRFLRR